MRPSAGITPDSSANRSADGDQSQAAHAEMQRVIEEMYTRQRQMEAELANTRMEAARRQGEPGVNQPGEASLSSLMRTLIETLTATTVTNSAREPSGPRDWKPPSWDGRAETFRDYLLRLKSSYRVRSGLKPTLSADYYWNTIYDTLPSRERARMRHFWERGSLTKGKDPEAFFTQLENVFADSNEQAKALEQLTCLKHSTGQPWHEHQLEFDGLLLSAGGDSWPDSAKIGYLKNTFSNSAKIYTATVPKTNDYYAFSEEVERIMTNLEMTDQFKAANRRWSKEKNKEPAPSSSEHGRIQSHHTTPAVDADGDTVMAPARTAGERSKRYGDRKGTGGKRKAKWVDTAERERRRENRLCFRCGASGHRIKECPYAPAVRPTKINAVPTHTVPTQPLLDDDTDSSDPAGYDSGKE